MTPSPPPDLAPPFELIEPAARRSPVVLNSPHSGARYPEPFVRASRLDPLTLRRSEDAFVDELFLPAVLLGAPMLRAHFPRAWLDVNREPYELDPRMFEDRLPPFVNTRSLRVAGGLGTIARIVGDSHEIYRGRLPVAEALERIERVYKPYHACLYGALAETQMRFGVALLLDCHSMPSTGNVRGERFRADVVLGDRYGTSCAPEISLMVERALTQAGYTVARNRPYAGGYITEHYGSPSSGIHALQIEVNRGLYMDEQRHVKSAGFDRLQADLCRAVSRLVEFPFHDLIAPRAAAE